MFFSLAMEKGTKIALGIGCGVLGLGGCVVGAAVAIMFLGGSEDSSGPMVDLEIPGMGPDGPYAQLATYVNDASTAIKKAAQGQPHDVRWNGPSPAQDLRGSDPGNAASLAALGANPEIFMTVLELEATNGSTRIRSNAIVFPDGRVKWGEVKRDTISTDPTPGLATAAPALDGAIRQMLTSLGGPCDLPVVSPEDVAPLPAEGREDLLRDVAAIPQACSPSVGGPGWQPKVDDITVLMRGNGTWAMARSSFQVQNGSVSLSPVRVRTM